MTVRLACSLCSVEFDTDELTDFLVDGEPMALDAECRFEFDLEDVEVIDF
jgi:hypothetical protein